MNEVLFNKYIFFKLKFLSLLDYKTFEMHAHKYNKKRYTNSFCFLVIQ